MDRNDHETNSDSRAWAVALVRWALALLFLLFGVGKLSDLKRFVAYYVLAPLEKSFLPKSILLVLGYAMPFIEIMLGLLLLLGVLRNQALIGACLYLMLLLLGQALFTLSISETLFVLPPMVLNAFIYVIITAALLAFEKYDQLLLGRYFRQRTPVNDSGKALDKIPNEEEKT